MKITIHDFSAAIKYVFARLITIFCRKKKNVWILSERRNEARDNAYHLFKYLNEECKKIKAFYLIDFDCADYKKISQYDNVVRFGSFKHYVLYFKCSALLSTHIYGYAPNKRVFQKLDKVFLRNQKVRVFLQHGIIMNFHPADMYENNNISLYVCSALREKKFLMEANHYPEENMCHSGLARYDNLGVTPIKKQILLMPTWRGYLSVLSNEQFLHSKYYLYIIGLMKDKRLNDLIERHGYNFVFYPHYEMQRFVSLFENANKNIVIAEHEKYDVQELLNSSAILISDYSSIHFDFAYQKKPICYFQYDRDEFYGSHYTKGYFDFHDDGFGPVADGIEDVVDFLEKLLSGTVRMSDCYEKRVDEFFTFRDRNNCERIVAKVMELEN